MARRPRCRGTQRARRLNGKATSRSCWRLPGRVARLPAWAEFYRPRFPRNPGHRCDAGTHAPAERLREGDEFAHSLPGPAAGVPARDLQCRPAVASPLVAGLDLARGGTVTLDQKEPWASIRSDPHRVRLHQTPLVGVPMVHGTFPCLSSNTGVIIYRLGSKFLMKGILTIAYKLLVNDRAKFAALLVGITFAVFLMIEMTSLFAGILQPLLGHRHQHRRLDLGHGPGGPDGRQLHPAAGLRAGRSAQHTGRQIRRSALFRRRAAEAARRHLSGRQRHRPRRHQPVRPAGAAHGKHRGHLRRERASSRSRTPSSTSWRTRRSAPSSNSTTIAASSSASPRSRPAACSACRRSTRPTTARSNTSPITRFTISYLLVEPKTPADVAAIKRRSQAPGYLALTKDEFIDKISNFYKYQTGIGTNMLIMTVISFIVGLSISGQTFYTFILENLEKFGALKAIGAKGRELIYMILFQASFVALTGYGLGVGLCALIDLAGPAQPARLRGDHHLRQSRPRLHHGGHHRRDLQLYRRAQGAEDRTLRYLPGLSMAATAIQAVGLNKWFGEGEARTIARPRRQLRRLFRRDPLHRRPIRQRQDHHAQHDLGNPSAQQRHREDRGHRHLEPRPTMRSPSSGCTRSASCFRTTICFRA